MAGDSSVALLRNIQTLFDAGTAGGLSDRQLLERFAARRDASAEAAFEVLVLRHGPMVLRVCSNVLRDPTDAQDAFQATFLVLVRRSSAIRKLESLGSWLYGVAYRVAARARVEASRRRAAERRGGLRVVAAMDSGDDGERDRGELGPAIQEEVRRLPERYRAVVVLCYWDGLTREQAAAQLGCPLGTVRSRLTRARTLLHRRLTSRGLAPLAGVVAASFDSASAGAGASRLSSVPSQLIHSTVRAATQVVAGQAMAQVASGVVASLVQRVVWSMTMIKINSVALGVILVGLTGYGVGLAAQRARESRSVLRVAAIDGNQAGRDGGLGRAQPDSKKPAALNPAAKTAGRERIYSNVSGQATIRKIVPDGSTVKRGQVVCELDSASLKDQLINQKITTESARDQFENSRLTREVAELAVVEYVEGIFKSDLAEVNDDVKIAETVLALDQEELNEVRADTAVKKLAIKRLELAVFRAQVALKREQSRLKVLVDYTKPRTVRQLRSDVEKARSDELPKKAIWQLEMAKEQKLKHQIAGCTIVAPRDGILVYDSESSIGKGATVGFRQRLFEIIPTSVTESGRQ
ncbi:MAG: sigma-70 family RNA polymerase sigma factor [Isosphaerales bacterium]